MPRASTQRLYILVLLISFQKINFSKLRLNFTPKIERKKFDRIQPFEISKKGGRCFVQTPFPQLQTKFH